MWFEWWPDGSTSPVRTSRQPVPAGSVEESYSAPLTDLTAGTTYRYRAVLETPSGIAKSGEMSFTTPAVAGAAPDVSR